jgi:hypothetical protein
MASETPLRHRTLRVLLAMDAAVLLAMGGLFLAVPAKVELVFGFHDLPGTASYLIGLWGCALISLGVGYAFAITDPVRNIAWVQAGIVRGALECGFGFLVVSQHMVAWHQAAFGTILSAAIAAGYAILYPSRSTLCTGK